MKVAVTGGSGQLGTLVLRRLFADRAVKEVVSIDVRPPAVVSAKLRTVEADVRDPELGRHLAGCDALAHLAFVVTRFPPRDVIDSVNVGGSRNVFEAAARAGVARVVYASSLAAYGVVPGHPVPLTEDAPRVHQRAFAYASTKYEVEAFLDAWEPAHPGVAVARLRPAILVGAHMDHPLGRALRRRVLAADGDAPLPIVWDEDVADAAHLALKQGARGAFNLCADDLRSAADLAREGGLRFVRLPAAVTRAAARVGPALARVGLGDPFDPAWLESSGVVMVPSSEKAKAALGWRPRHPTAADVIRHYAKVVPARPDPRLVVFFKLVTAGARARDVPHDAKKVYLTIHLALTGRGGGDWTLALAAGRPTITPGVPRPPSAVLTLPAALLLDALAGKADLTAAQLTGRVRIEGEAMAMMALGGILGMFRATAARTDAQGRVARRLGEWFAQRG